MCKHDIVRSWIRSAKSSFGCLLETRVQKDNSDIIASVFPGWSSLTNYDYHRLGRIWLIWSDKITITTLYKSPQLITVKVKTYIGEEFLCSCVYTSNFRSDRAMLWDELRQNIDLFATGNVPWIIIGDYYISLASEEHSRVADYISDQAWMQDFQSLVSYCELMDLGYVGPKFIWWNCQQEDHIGKN